MRQKSVRQPWILYRLPFRDWVSRSRLSEACVLEFEGGDRELREPANRFACRLYYGRGPSINRIGARRAKSSRARLNRSLRVPLSHGLVRPLVSDNACFTSRLRISVQSSPFFFFYNVYTHFTHVRACWLLRFLTDDGNIDLNRKHDKLDYVWKKWNDCHYILYRIRFLYWYIKCTTCCYNNSYSM